MIRYCFVCLLIACGPAQPEEKERECIEREELPAGAVLSGHDAQAMLDPLFGSWPGSLSWESGGSTGVVYAVVQNPSEPLYRNHCSSPDGAYTYADGSLSTDDGALMESFKVIVKSDLVNRNPERYNPRTNMSPHGIPDSNWQGSVGEKLNTDLSRYSDAALVLELSWNSQLRLPTYTELFFSGTVAATETHDRFLVATLNFE